MMETVDNYFLEPFEDSLFSICCWLYLTLILWTFNQGISYKFWWNFDEKDGAGKKNQRHYTSLLAFSGTTTSFPIKFFLFEFQRDDLVSRELTIPSSEHVLVLSQDRATREQIVKDFTSRSREILQQALTWAPVPTKSFLKVLVISFS